MDPEKFVEISDETWFETIDTDYCSIPLGEIYIISSDMFNLIPLRPDDDYEKPEDRKIIEGFPKIIMGKYGKFKFKISIWYVYDKIYHTLQEMKKVIEVKMNDEYVWVLNYDRRYDITSRTIYINRKIFNELVNRIINKLNKLDIPCDDPRGEVITKKTIDEIICNLLNELIGKKPFKPINRYYVNENFEIKDI